VLLSQDAKTAKVLFLWILYENSESIKTPALRATAFVFAFTIINVFLRVLCVFAVQIYYSYRNALIGLLFATRVVFPATVSQAMTSAINPETTHIGIINKGLIWY
jgi:cytochrome c biogenesis protein CcdA